MDKDRIAGSSKDFAGKVEGAVGEIAGDSKSQAAGHARETAGICTAKQRMQRATPRMPRSATPKTLMRTAAIPSTTAHKRSRKRYRTIRSVRC